MTNRRKPTTSIDSVVTFTHDGEEVIATVARTQWSAAGMTYVWRTDDDRTIMTQGVPNDVVVLVDPAARK